MRKRFSTRVPIACAFLTALLGLPAAPADAVTIFAGTCATTARLEGIRLVLDGTCVYAPQITSTLHAYGDVTSVLNLGVCSTGVYRSDGYFVSTAGTGEDGTLHLVNSSTLSLAFVSTSMRIIFSGELAPSALNGTCPSQWTGVIVIEDPALEE